MSSGLISEATGTLQGDPQIPGAWYDQIVNYLETLISSCNALLLYVEKGYTFRQIARELHIGPSTAQVRISLARSWLQEHYFIPDPEFLI